ncbi:MAG: hypothetical protein VB078_06975 [Clostridiaceae bacterium]|nr:hypothetical protein [Clostridiaceae bacterium]
MIPWIQIYSNLPQHPKTSALADELGFKGTLINPNAQAVGLLVCLWTWAIQNAYSGDLSGCSIRAIAEACQWQRKPETLVAALKNAGWIDTDMKLHDWEEYASLLIDQEENRKAKTRERVKRYRDGKKAEAKEECNVTAALPSNVTDTLCNAPTRPYQTLPNLKDNYGGGGYAREPDDVNVFFRDRDLDPSAYFGMTEQLYNDCEAFTAQVFDSFTSRQPTKIDIANVFQAIRESRRNSDATWDVQLSDHRKQLLMYAFQTANNAGKPGEWKYINGVLNKIAGRSIETLEQAERFDVDRQNNC